MWKLLFVGSVFTILNIVQCCQLSENPKVDLNTKRDSKKVTALLILSSKIPKLCADKLSNKNLKEIILYNNDMKSIETQAFSKLPQLAKLVITNNLLTKIEDGWLDNENLEHLDLQFNTIQTISSNSFANIPNLKKIFLGGNDIAHVDAKWFVNSLKLEMIDLLGNKIRVIPEGFLKFAKTHEVPLNIIFSSNPVDTIEANAFQNIATIEKLALAQVTLNNIHAMFKDVGKVDMIILSSNRTSCYSEKELDVLKITKQIGMGIHSMSLPIECSVQLNNWAENNNITFVKTYN